MVEASELRGGFRKNAMAVLKWVSYYMIPVGIRKLIRAGLEKNITRRQAAIYERMSRRVPRRKETHFKFLGGDILAPDFASFYSSFVSVFVHESLKFSADTDAPIIVDIGCNIGVTVAYYKHLYPNAKVYAIEADPAIFGYLKENLARLGFQDVVAINMAAWKNETELSFHPDGADGGRVDVSATLDKGIVVKAMDISAFLSQFTRIDLLKIDIEGAEDEILPCCVRHFDKIQRIFVEYHFEPGKKQNVGAIISALVEAGFRINLKTEYCPTSPFVLGHETATYDNQVGLFAFRNGS